MERNSDISLYIASNVMNLDFESQLAQDLRKLGYHVLDAQESATYLVINDISKDFDINNFRHCLKIALVNDQPIIFMSKGIPFFMKYDDGTYFTRLYVNYYKSKSFENSSIFIDYHVDNPPGFHSDIKPTVFVNINDDRKIYALKHDGQQPPQSDKDRCCWKVWKGLYY